MIKMSNTLPIIDRVNAGYGFIVALLSYFLGENWYLFVAYLALNVGDEVTGWIKSKQQHKLSSSKGSEGILKKFGYWGLICLSFGMSYVFSHIGKTLGIDLHITTLIGWFVLASLIINEARSILENLVEAGIEIPKILINGLEIADKAIGKNESDETK